jgi:hypothetical protein
LFSWWYKVQKETNNSNNTNSQVLFD